MILEISALFGLFFLVIIPAFIEIFMVFYELWRIKKRFNRRLQSMIEKNNLQFASSNSELKAQNKGRETGRKKLEW